MSTCFLKITASYIGIATMVFGFVFSTAVQADDGVFGPDRTTFANPENVEMPVNRLTCINTDSDLDYFVFTAPANMEITIRASGSWFDDPHAAVYRNGQWTPFLSDDDSGPGRDAKIKFFAQGGQEYKVRVGCADNGLCRVKIDSDYLVIRNCDGRDRNAASLISTWVPQLDRYSWSQRTNLGAERFGSEVSRTFDIEHYSLEPVTINAITPIGSAEQISMSSRLTFPRRLFSFMPSQLDFNLHPTRLGNVETTFNFQYRVGSRNLNKRLTLAGKGVASTTASPMGAAFSYGSYIFNGQFSDSNDVAAYYRIRVPFDATFYRAVVYAMPRGGNPIEVVGTVFTNNMQTNCVTDEWGRGFMWSENRLLQGSEFLIKVELDPDQEWLGDPGEEAWRLPANYQLFVYLVPTR